jgi:hypothetical protein
MERQVTRHDCLPSLLGDVDKSSEKVAPKTFVPDRLEQARKEKKSPVPA